MRLSRLYLGLSLWTLCAACATTEPVLRPLCPQPNRLEETDYARIVAEGPDRPAVRWVSRVVGYCWPEEAAEVLDRGQD